ncbi:hypothetical protein DAERI_090015 [Deinococcus aerius]|uniref:Uncharacterized protein n=1 Tax=Deinococcus aerius TaxID=200253 RepID=A0A2I9CWM3_9DEIO|nr:hypothetical protein [Deinococcus aerius]GBF06429.1 hypothetical protein DAERI_090015 [Deinococcus aerius]
MPDPVDLQAQVERERFPDGTRVTVLPEPDGRVFRLTRAEGGVEILLTDEAVRMYGEGPSVALVLGRLREWAEGALPAAQAPGVYERQVFVGD